MTTLQRTATAAEIATPRRQLGQIAWKWMVTTDHKVIGNLYFVTSMFFFLFGGILAMGIRAELAWPGLQYLSYETYNQFFTMQDRKSTRLNSSHTEQSRMPSSA